MRVVVAVAVPRWAGTIGGDTRKMMLNSDTDDSEAIRRFVATALLGRAMQAQRVSPSGERAGWRAILIRGRIVNAAGFSEELPETGTQGSLLQSQSMSCSKSGTPHALSYCRLRNRSTSSSRTTPHLQVLGRSSGRS